MGSPSWFEVALTKMYFPIKLCQGFRICAILHSLRKGTLPIQAQAFEDATFRVLIWADSWPGLCFVLVSR